MSKSATQDPGASGLVLLGLACLLVLVFGLGLWAVKARIEGAIIVQGRVEAGRIRQIVQHPTGGMAQRVHVAEGQAVQAGDLLIELDVAPQLRDFDFVQEQLFDLMIRQERLQALFSGQAVLSLSPEALRLRDASPERGAFVQRQIRLFEASLATREVQNRQAAARQAQLAARVVGLEVQVEAVARQLPLTAAALDNQKTLFERGLVPATSVLEFEQEMSRLEGQLGELQASKAQAHEQITQVQIMIQQELAKANEAAMAEAQELEEKIRILRNDARRLKEEIEASRIFAPIAGLVHGLQVQTRGVALRPAETLLSIIPQDPPSVMMARVRPADIDQIEQGQQVKLRLSSLGQRLAPEIFGRVTHISADVHRDTRSEIDFYQVEVTFDRDMATQLPGDMEILPGMPVEAYIYTQGTSPLAYLIKPMADYFARALRES